MLQAQNISLRRGGRTLLHQVSVQLIPGQLLMVLGPNGAGKSTLLRTLAGELRADRGGVTLDARPLSEWGLQALARRRAVMTQQVQIPFALGVREVVELGLMDWSLSAARREALVYDQLQRVGMEAYRDRAYPELSGGEQQRVQLARTLTQLSAGGEKGGYLLLDEPLAALDLKQQQRTLRLLRTLCAEEGVGVLCVIHDLNLACLYADRLLLLDCGEPVFVGQPHELLQQRVVERTYDADLIRLCHPEAALPQWQFRR